MASKTKILVICVVILLSLALLPFILTFGWMAGIICLIIFWKKNADNPDKRKKYTIGIAIPTALSLAFIVYAIVFAPPSPTELTLITATEAKELEVNSDYIINLSYEPEDATLSNITYTVDNPSLATVAPDSENSTILTLHTIKEGTITITAEKNGVESNTLTFEIIDKERIEREKAEELARIETEKKAQAEKEQAAKAEQKRLEEEKAQQEAEQKRLSEEQDAKVAEEKQLAEEKAAQEEAKRLAAKQAAAEEKARQEAEQAAQSSNTNTSTATTNRTSSQTPTTSTGSGGNNNFNTYNNTEQQSTTASWVLNTNSMKIHYSSCRSVPKISPDNYATSNENLDSLKAQGYDTCGICFK